MWLIAYNFSKLIFSPSGKKIGKKSVIFLCIFYTALSRLNIFSKHQLCYCFWGNGDTNTCHSRTFSWQCQGSNLFCRKGMGSIIELLWPFPSGTLLQGRDISQVVHSVEVNVPCTRCLMDHIPMYHIWCDHQQVSRKIGTSSWKKARGVRFGNWSTEKFSWHSTATLWHIVAIFTSYKDPIRKKPLFKNPTGKMK